MGQPGPISTVVCLAAGAIVLGVSILILPAAELLPAQVYPAKRDSGESLVRNMPGASEAMKFYAGMGTTMLGWFQLPTQVKDDDKTIDADAMKNWSTELMKVNGDAYGSEVKKQVTETLGEQELKKVVDLIHVDKNFIYNAYALFLGFALLFGAVAIQAMGRDPNEKTILPVKK